MLLDDIIEAVGFKSGSSTPQRSGSTAGLHRPRLSIDSATPAIDLPQLSSSLPGSLSGSSHLLTPRQGSHTMDFFEMCASLITTLARWALLTCLRLCNLDVSGVFKLITDRGCRECRCLEWLLLSVSSPTVLFYWIGGSDWKCKWQGRCGIRLGWREREWGGKIVGVIISCFDSHWVKVLMSYTSGCSWGESMN